MADVEPIGPAATPVRSEDQAASARMADAYDATAYPSGLFPQASPDRLAVIATLHGLSPPPIATARLLELGGGDGLNALGFAAAYPEGQALSLDFARRPVARGAALADAAGLGNARIEWGDIVAAADTLAGPFDYIVAHGVYAWVPETVRDALMRLIGRLLAPNGVAFVSYNALPGGYLRLMLRDLVLHRVADEPAGPERVRAARGIYRALAEREPNSPLQTVLREHAAKAADTPDHVLAHDECGEVYAPQSLSAVVAAAAAHGLRYLNDARTRVVTDGFVAPDDTELDERGIVRRAQAADHLHVTYFRESIFVRAEASPARRLDLDEVRKLLVSFRGKRVAANKFEVSKGKFELGDDALSDLLERADRLRPARVALAGEGLSDDQLAALVALFERGVVDLHAAPLPAAATIPVRPRASPLARAQLAAGASALARLDGILTGFDDVPGARAVLELLDGRRTVAELDQAWRATPYAAECSLDKALDLVRQAALLMPEPD